MAYELETRCIHNQESQKDVYGAVTTPIYQTAMFSHPGIGKSGGYDYTRESNPTRSHLENILKSLEKGADSIVCSSGMAAIQLALSLFEPQDHILCGDDLYGGSIRMFEAYQKQGLTFSYVDTRDTQEVEAAILPRTKALYIETPSNPLMRITDLGAMAHLARKYNLLLIVDNTFLSPYFLTPIEYGADIVIHSGTKFLNGHNDVIAGVISLKDEQIAKKLRYTYKTIGCCLSPFDSYLFLRGLKTLGIRQEKQQENAIQIAQWLSQQKEVVSVYYPGLVTHPGHAIHKAQTRGYGSMISFHVDTQQRARDILENISLITYAESLGGIETLLTYPMIQTHGDLSKEERERKQITEKFLRMSVGIENVADLLKDLEQAFEKSRG